MGDEFLVETYFLGFEALQIIWNFSKHIFHLSLCLFEIIEQEDGGLVRVSDLFLDHRKFVSLVQPYELLFLQILFAGALILGWGVVNF